jgi:GntR family transcriptional regulator, transcriptional repressor for pyruvate dehydrogenase complex
MYSRSVRQLDKSEEIAASAEAGGWNSNVPTARMGDRLARHISALIGCGEFGEGERLPAESDLAVRFGVSRPVIREALSRLRSTGVITSRKGSGSYVQRRAERPAEIHAEIGFGPLTSLAQVRKCYEFRVSFEGEAAYHAAQDRSADMLIAMRDALERMATDIAEMGGMNADLAFHQAVARASGNDFFETVMRSMHKPLEFAVNLARSLALTRSTEHMLTVQAEHVAIYEAIEAQDRDAARHAMRRHIRNACSRVFEGPAGSAMPPGGFAGDDRDPA